MQRLPNIHQENMDESLVKVFFSASNERLRNFNRFAMRDRVQHQEELLESCFETALAAESCFADDVWLKGGAYLNQHQHVLKNHALSQPPEHDYYGQFVDLTWTKLALLLEGFRVGACNDVANSKKAKELQKAARENLQDILNRIQSYDPDQLIPDNIS